MKAIVLFLLFSQVIVRIALAQDARIVEKTYPSPDEARRPDRTLSTTLSGPAKLITYSPDGRVLAAADGKLVRIFDARTGEQGTGDLLVTCEGHAGTLLSIAFSDDGKSMISLADDQTLRTWNATTGAMVSQREATADVRSIVMRATTRPAQAIAFSSKGDQFAVADGTTVKVFDTATQKLLTTLVGHPNDVISIAFNPNGQKMASGGADGSIRYWTVPLPPIPPADLLKITQALPSKATATPKKPRRILVFWRADAILHKGGVPAANHAIELMGEKTGAYDADFSREYEALDPKVLANYDAIIMNSTAHLCIPDAAKKALLDYVNNGGGVIGIHAAIDTFRQWPEGAAIIGATFGGHPWHPSGTWAVKLDEPAHPLLRAWNAKNFRMHDEVYELADPYSRADRRVLMSLDLSDEATANVTPLHRADKDFAVSWIKRHGKGRVFFCMFGQIAEPFQRVEVLQYCLDGIQYAVGDLDVDDRPAKTD